MKRRAAGYEDFVEHPRYGKAPRLTGLDVADSPDGTVYCHWHSPPGVRIPHTAIVADVERQAPATLHVTHYFDSRRDCRACGKPFLFFAAEQKHWYEELGFPLEADCLECPLCRKDAQRLRTLCRKYESLLAKKTRTEAEALELVAHALDLVESSIFSRKIVPKLRGLLKPLLSNHEAPHSARARAFVKRIEGLAAAARV